MTNRGRSIKGLIKSQRQRHHKDYQGEQSHEKNCKRVTAIICIGREPNVIALHIGVTGLPQRESPLVRKMLEEKTIPVNKRQSPESKALCSMFSLAHEIANFSRFVFKYFNALCFYSKSSFLS